MSGPQIRAPDLAKFGQMMLEVGRRIVREGPVLKAKQQELSNDPPPLKPVVEGPAWGHAAEGYLGPFLYMMPRHRMVAVRQRRYRMGTNAEDPRTSFTDFMEMVAGLVPDKPKP